MTVTVGAGVFEGAGVSVGGEVTVGVGLGGAGEKARPDLARKAMTSAPATMNSAAPPIRVGQPNVIPVLTPLRRAGWTGRAAPG